MNRPPSNEHWLVQSKAAGSKKWLVTCRYCEAVVKRTADEINIGYNPCRCRRPRKNAMTFTYEGQTLPLSVWAARYPHRIRINSVRTRFQLRKKGKKNYTDEEVLFGLRTDVEPVDPVNQATSEASRAGIDVFRAMLPKMERLVIESVVDYVAPRIMRHNQELLTGRYVAGAAFILEATGGLTIQDHMNAGTPMADLVTMLRMEIFPSKDEKYRRLKDFIILDEPEPDVLLETGLTHTEIQQLLSLVSLEMLASI